MEYKTFGLSAKGFLPEKPGTRHLPAEYEAFDELVASLRDLSPDEIRLRVANLPILSWDFDEEARWHRSYLVLTMISHAYLWCDKTNVPQTLPAVLAIPWYKVSQYLRIVPVLTLTAVSLYNWYFKEGKEFSLDNIASAELITGKDDEAWFYLVMTAIEGRSRILIDAVNIFLENKTKENALKAFAIFHVEIEIFTAIISRMKERCDPDVFYNVLRWYFKGSADKEFFPNGLILEGTGETVGYNGGSAAQSSTIRLLDEALQIEHPGPAGKYLEDMLNYMPGGHRDYLLLVREKCRLHDYVGEDEELKKAYDKCLTSLVKFRRGHFGLASKYIMEKAPGENGVKGTGGTDLKNFLNEIITDNSERRFTH
jgi:indoleamine 2,3-dioxygenase